MSVKEHRKGHVYAFIIACVVKVVKYTQRQKNDTPTKLLFSQIVLLYGNS